MVKKQHIMVASMAIILTAAASYIYYSFTTTSNDVLEEVDFSTLKDADVNAMALVKERMNAPAPSVQEQR